MDHEEVLEQLEDAAIEPGGLERLMAGDTSTAALVASHLAGCPDCSLELERLRRTVGVIRPAVRAVPPPELRQRTLDYVAAMGRPRGAAAVVSTASAAATASADALSEPPPPPIAPWPVAATPGPASRPALVRFSRARIVTVGALAAALVVAVLGTGFVINNSRDATSHEQAQEIEALGDVARWTLQVDGQQDARRVALVDVEGSQANATLLYSPSSQDVVVVANDLAMPATGQEYRCWVEINGQRVPIGKMFFGGDLAYWVGKAPEVAGIPAGARFGVTLVDNTNPSAPGRPILASES